MTCTKIQNKIKNTNIFFHPPPPLSSEETGTTKLLLCTYQNPTNSLPTPTTVGDNRSFIKLKYDVLTFIRKVYPASTAALTSLPAEVKFLLKLG